MPDALICYPGSIEKLKLLGATYLLTTYSGERNGMNVRAEEVHENDGGAEEEKNEDEDEAIEMTRSGQAVTKPTHLI
jgi:hypothetical protein